MKHHQFHIQYFPPSDVWPDGGFSLYMINGDQIAERIGFENDKIVRRDPWPGYIGTYATMSEVSSEINAICEPI